MFTGCSKKISDQAKLSVPNKNLSMTDEKEKKSFCHCFKTAITKQFRLIKEPKIATFQSYVNLESIDLIEGHKAIQLPLNEPLITPSLIEHKITLNESTSIPFFFKSKIYKEDNNFKINLNFTPQLFTSKTVRNLFFAIKQNPEQNNVAKFVELDYKKTRKK